MDISDLFSRFRKKDHEPFHDNSHRERICIYTAVSAGCDAIRQPLFVNPEIDFFVFCDNEEQPISPPWQRLPMDFYLRNPRVSSRYYKLLPHKFFESYDISMWIDASFLIKKDPAALIYSCLKDNDMAFLKHPDRNCIYKEAKVVVEKRLEYEATVIKQMERYKQEGYPAGNGLIFGGIILRRHNKVQVIKIMEDWWHEVSHYSQRDQLSANYVIWKNRASYAIIPGKQWRHNYFKYFRHEHQLNRKSYLDPGQADIIIRS